MENKKLRYFTGFGNEHATEARAGRAAGRPERAAAAAARSLHRADLGHPVHRAARREPALLALPHPALGDASAVSPDRQRPRSQRAVRRGRAAAQPAQMEPAAVSRTSRPISSTGSSRWAATAMRAARSGVAVHIYRATKPMQRRVFYDADGELLIVPQLGRLLLATELGVVEARPGEIAVIPRGIKFRVELPDGRARGYVCENYGALFRLPELGPIGANGLANPRDFRTPVAAFEDRDEPCEVVAKFEGNLWADRTRPFAARRRRLARQLRALCLRSRAFQYDRHGQLRPSGPVDLHRADLAERGARHRQLRFRDLPAALAGGRAHLPPALVPPQLHERVHGPRARRLRRQGRGLRAGRRLAAQLHVRARPRPGHLREGRRGRT